MRHRRGSLLWFLFSPRGRISRIEFWVYHLAMLVLAFSWLIALGTTADAIDRPPDATLSLAVGFATLGVVPLTMVTTLAVWAKRFHDRNKSAWWALIGLIPVLGTAWIIVECGCLIGTRGSNRFGPNPLGVHMDDVGSVFD